MPYYYEPQYSPTGGKRKYGARNYFSKHYHPPHSRYQPQPTPHYHETAPPKTAEFFWNPFAEHPDPGKHIMLKERNGKDCKVFMREEGEIGKGTFGSIKSVLVKAHNQPMERLAMKITVPGEEDLGTIEANIMLKMKHTNVVRLKYYYEAKGAIRLLMEIMDEGDLHHLIHRVWTPKNGLGIYCELFGFQMFRGLAYMHSIGITHRDIKPENVLISRTSGLAKLTDFNCSTKMSDKKEHSPRVGTKSYNAPELLLGSRLYNEKVDVWSAAVVLTAMILKKSVFHVGASTGVEPLTTIMDFLGSPTKDDFDRMKVSMEEREKCPKVIKNRSFSVSMGYAPGIHNKHALMELVPHVFSYKVNKRYSAYQVCNHSMFDFLRSGQAVLENGYPLPNVFTFSNSERMYNFR